MLQKDERVYMMILRKAVEKKAHFKIRTSKDFQKLSDDLAETGAGYLSASTLKRFWGYVKDTAGKHTSTLDILARYAGFEAGYYQFVKQCRESDGIESDYESLRVLDVFSMEPGIAVEVKWLPDRRIIMKYEGDCIFEVVKAENTKLATGCIVRCSRLIEGDRLMMDILDKQLAPNQLYEAGKVNGITWNLIEI